jgi:predicted amidohydrolase YtcJ
MKRIVEAALGAVLALLAACGQQPNPPTTAKANEVSDPATAIYFGGDILTMEGDTPAYAEAVAVKGERISFVGAKTEAMKQQGASTTLIDLQGKTLMPGFIDPHLHPILGSVILNTRFASPFDWVFPWGDAKAVRGHEAFMAKVIAYSKELSNPTEPLVVWGYMEPFHGAMSRKVLDGISRTRPIIVWQYSAHEMFFNTAALDFYKLNEAETRGNKQIDWKLGRYWEAGFFSVALPKLAPSLMGKEAMQAGLERFRAVTHQGGVTTVGDMATGSSGDLDGDVKMMSAALENDATPFRVQLTPDVNTLGLQMGDGDKVLAFVKELPKRNSPHLAFTNNIKLFSDGAFFGQAMQLEAPGYKDGHHGDWIMEPERLRKTMKLWWDQGYTIHIHCNGSLGLTVILDALEMLQKNNPRQDHRLTIEHFGVSTAEQAQRIAALGAVVSANPYYMYSMADKFAAGNLDKKRASEIVRAGSLLENKIPFAFHSDFTMAPIQPLLLAWIAVNRVTAEGTVMAPDQKIPAYNALQAITSNAAYVLRFEEKVGSIKAGKKADFVVLEENPLKIDPMKIKDIRVLETVYEGKAFPMH